MPWPESVILLTLHGSPRVLSTEAQDLDISLLLPTPHFNAGMEFEWEDVSRYKSMWDHSERLVRKKLFKGHVKFGYKVLEEAVYDQLLTVLKLPSFLLQPRTATGSDPVPSGGVPIYEMKCVSRLPVTRPLYDERFPIIIQLETVHVVEEDLPTPPSTRVVCPSDGFLVNATNAPPYFEDDSDVYLDAIVADEDGLKRITKRIIDDAGDDITVGGSTFEPLLVTSETAYQVESISAQGTLEDDRTYRDIIYVVFEDAADTECTVTTPASDSAGQAADLSFVIYEETP